jgi:hypothetical protein
VTKASDPETELLGDRAAIADLMHRYALAIRARTPLLGAELFTDDAIFENWQVGPAGSGERVLKFRSTGRSEILQMLTENAAQEPRLIPMIHNLIIEVRQSQAEATSVMVAAVMPGGRQILGEYLDRFRYDSGWRFTHRSFTQIGSLAS